MFSEVVERVAGADDAALLARLRELDGIQREVAGEQAAVLAELEQRKAYRHGQHATMYGLLRSALHWSDRDCLERMRIARFAAAHPDAGDALFDHRASIANIAELARAANKPNVGDGHDHEIGALLRLAESSEYDDFRRNVANFEQNCDTAAAHEDAQTAHEARNAHMHVTAEGGELVAEFGPLDATIIREVFDQYVHAEWLTDWEATVAHYGDEASTLLMPRTPAQRRADAVKQIHLDAASAAPGARPPQPVVNVHVDHHSFQDILVEAELLPERDVDPFDDPLPHVAQRFSHTEHGQPVDQRTVLQFLLYGYVRFVIRNDQGVPIRWGRERRLFEGAARDAVRSLSTRCTHPGCRVPTRRTQTDHTVDFAAGGRTDPDNGNPRCLRHNLIKNRGYTVHRDAQGTWHTYHPDGTEVA
jgi:hypothetical protein